jgi:hypothetical protein
VWRCHWRRMRPSTKSSAGKSPDGNLSTSIECSNYGNRAKSLSRRTEEYWCRRRESNPRPRDYETLALPLSHAGTETIIDAKGSLAGVSSFRSHPVRSYACDGAGTKDFSPDHGCAFVSVRASDMIFSISSAVRGNRAVNSRNPSWVTSTSSSMRTPRFSWGM